MEDELRKVGQKPLHREGARDGNWVLLDYPDIVVHVLLAEAREFTDLRPCGTTVQSSTSRN